MKRGFVAEYIGHLATNGDRQVAHVDDTAELHGEVLGFQVQEKPIEPRSLLSGHGCAL